MHSSTSSARGRENTRGDAQRTPGCSLRDRSGSGEETNPVLFLRACTLAAFAPLWQPAMRRAGVCGKPRRTPTVATTNTLDWLVQPGLPVGVSIP